MTGCHDVPVARPLAVPALSVRIPLYCRDLLPGAGRAATKDRQKVRLA